MFECESVQALPCSVSRPARQSTPTNDANFPGKSSWFSNGRNNNRFFDARSACLNRLFLANRENNAPFLTSAILLIFNDRGTLMSPNRATRERRRGDSPRRRGPPTSRPFHENRRKSPRARNAWLGREDFEPPYGGIKIRCLTTWRRPKLRRGRPGSRDTHKAARAAPQHACDDIPRRRQTPLTFRLDFVCHTARPARGIRRRASRMRETGGWGPFIITHRPARRCAGG